MELIVDASAESTVIGLAARGELASDVQCLDPQQHTQQLLSAVLHAMGETATSFDDVEVIVMALGPGPFNGLRVAAATAKGIAAGTGAALVGVPTMRAEVHRCPPSLGTVRPVLRAGRTGFSTALYKWQGDAWTQVEELTYVALRDVHQITASTVPLCGDTESLPDEENWYRPDTQATRLQTLALLGWQDYAAGRTVTPAALQPIYLRPPHITTPRQRRH